MRSLLRGVLRRIWQLSGGVRRRLLEKANRHLIAQFEPWLARIDRAHAQNQLLARDVELLGDCIIRELARLQSHVDAIDQRLQAIGAEVVDTVDTSAQESRMPYLSQRREAA